MSEWKEYRLDELGFVGRGKSRHRPRNAPFLYGGTYPFIQTADVKNANLYITEYTQTYSKEGLNQSKLWNEGTLCITIAANIAEVGILKLKACFPDSIIGFIANDSRCDTRYIKYYFDIFQKTFQQISQGSTQDNLSASKLLSLKIPAPSLPTQKKIAKILSNYDDLIENNLKRIKLLEESARLTYEEWFLRFRIDGEKLDIDSGTGLPFGWEEKRIKDFGQVITGKTPSTSNDKYYNGDVPFVKTPNMHKYPYVLETDDYLTEKGASTQNNKFLKKNSLMVSCIGSAGVYALVSRDCQTNQQINSIKFFKKEYTFYMYGFSQYFKIILDALGSNGATMTNVNKTKFENIKVVIPDILILEKYHKEVESKFETILNLLEQNQLLKEARDILLPRLMTGMIDVEKIDVI